ncbi:acyltransferase [Kineococcus indalonis]|uniref:acyltransferase n=1 Tax=Kineococcus indalonis TaxID=2696566 RepID=UPI00196B117E|nr:acyltransferase [Kineococcus indalonis]
MDPATTNATTNSAGSTPGSTPVPPPRTGYDRGRELVHRARSRARYLAALAVQPRLAGNPLALGPRVQLELGPGVRFHRGPGVTIAGDFHGVFHADVDWGADVFVNVGCYVSVHSGLTVGDRCRFGERVSVHDEDHVFEPLGADRGRYRTSPVVIGPDVWIGAGSTVLRGARIGAGSVVAAGSVVRGEVPEGVLVAGAPARVVRALRS